MTQAEVWELVIANQRLLRREIRKFLPRERQGELDEMYSDVVLARAQRIMELYKPDHQAAGTSKTARPLTYLIANCRWYAYKWVHGRNGSWQEPSPVKRARSLSPIPETSGIGDSDREALRAFEPSYLQNYDTPLRVQSILGQLPVEAADLLRWHVMSGFTFKEIGDHLGIGARRVSIDFTRAFALARELVEADPESESLPI
jgi:DNA-directed RNA polymerase specialized sigma24 family protein